MIERDNINNEGENMSYIGLESVGSIVTIDGIVLPTDVSDTSGVHLLDTDDDWWGYMSVADCNELMGFLTPLVLNGDLEWDGSFVNWGMERLQYVINHNYLIENMETI